MLIIKLVKKLFVSASGLFTYLSLPFVAFAGNAATEDTTRRNVDPCTSAKDIGKIVCDLGLNPARTIQNIVIFIIILAIIIALVYLLYGGIKWITSKGDKTEVESARNHIIAAILGLIVVFLAIFVLAIILAAFGIEFKNLEIPRIGGPTPTL